MEGKIKDESKINAKKGRKRRRRTKTQKEWNNRGKRKSESGKKAKIVKRE